jgi:Uma2 family endonuclease
MRRILIPDPAPPAVAELLEQRRTAGADRFDEMWDGVLHMIPPPSHAHELLLTRLLRLLGPVADEAGLELTGGVAIGVGPEDYRVPDFALHRPGAAQQWHPTAALVGEIISPGDETWEKMPFYHAHGVEEVLVVDLAQRTVTWLALPLDLGDYVQRPGDERSALVSLNVRGAEDRRGEGHSEAHRRRRCLAARQPAGATPEIDHLGAPRDRATAMEGRGGTMARVNTDRGEGTR